MKRIPEKKHIPIVSRNLLRAWGALLVLTGFALYVSISSVKTSAQVPMEASSTWWEVQAVDTMKDSRDLARAKLDDLTFDAEIQRQIQRIKDVGATYVAVATPYDDEFIPFLGRWVTAARNVGLHVWFRGNFAGWEGWFNYPRITKEEHLAKLEQFITANPSLFEKGDIFTPCHECESGGPGDPRNTHDVDGFRSFLIADRNVAIKAFKSVNKDVYVGYIPTNGDVAKLIMDEKTTEALGGVVTIDHYVKTETDMARDLDILEQQSKGNIMIGEVGAPVPDLQGALTPAQQAEWLDKTLHVLASDSKVIGMNYWTAMHSSTELWNNDGSPRPAVDILKKYYHPKTISVQVTDEFAEPIANATVRTHRKQQQTDVRGVAIIPVIDAETIATISATEHNNQTVVLLVNEPIQPVILASQQNNLLLQIKRFFFRYTPFLFLKFTWFRA